MYQLVVYHTTSTTFIQFAINTNIMLTVLASSLPIYQWFLTFYLVGTTWEKLRNIRTSWHEITWIIQYFVQIYDEEQKKKVFDIFTCRLPYNLFVLCEV